MGRLDDVCPTCEAALPRRPKRMARCRTCQTPIHVLKRPWDLERVLVRPEDAPAVRLQADAFWSFLHSVEKAVDMHPSFPALAHELRHGARGRTVVDWPLLRELAEAFLKRLDEEDHRIRLPFETRQGIRDHWRRNGWPV